MSKMHEVAEEDLQNEMQLKVARMERGSHRRVGYAYPKCGLCDPAYDGITSRDAG